MPAFVRSVGRVLDGNNPGAVLERDHGAWYRALFAPSVSAGILGAAYCAESPGCASKSNKSCGIIQQ